jgi:integrase/recombinase XerD
MKNFESFLAPQLNDFIAYRQGLGYNTTLSRAHFLVFDRHLRKTNADWHALTPSYFLEMRANLEIEPSSINHLFSSLRGFFNFLLRREEVLENPLLDIPRLKENTVVPFVLSPEQIGQLLQVLCRRVRRNEKYFLTDLAVYLTVLLLARCGMRISEPLMAMKHHYHRFSREFNRQII